jgi:hypothetical protein
MTCLQNNAALVQQPSEWRDKRAAENGKFSHRAGRHVEQAN